MKDLNKSNVKQTLFFFFLMVTILLIAIMCNIYTVQPSSTEYYLAALTAKIMYKIIQNEGNQHSDKRTELTPRVESHC